MLKTTANKITMLRVVLVPVFMVLAYSGSLTAAFIVYVIACLSDFVDGYIARHYNQTSDFGKFADPLAGMDSGCSRFQRVCSLRAKTQRRSQEPGDSSSMVREDQNSLYNGRSRCNDAFPKSQNSQYCSKHSNPYHYALFRSRILY